MKKKGIVLLCILIYLCFLTVPYLYHKNVSDSFKNAFAGRCFYGEDAGSERVAYVNDNADALLYRLHMIEEAKEEIILSTFDFNADESGKTVMAALYRAAQRGVSVRVIMDGISGLTDAAASGWFRAFSAHPDISLKIYNPVNLLKPWNLQARLHDKYLIIDREMYLIGGRNTMDLFLKNDSPGQNIDRELFVYDTARSKGGSVTELCAYFEAVWALPDSRLYNGKKKDDAEKTVLLKERGELLPTLYPEAYRDWDYRALTVETNRISLLSNPIGTENKEPQLWYALNRLMREGSGITVYTPYIICGKEMYRDLTALTGGGASVEIITNDVESGANPWGCTDYLNQKEKIFETGVKVYEFMGTHSCHTKAVLIDERMSIVGSFNMDMRSAYIDTELMLAVDSEALNRLIREEAERDKTCSKTVQADGSYRYGENYAAREISFAKRILYGLLRGIVMPIRRFL